MVVNYDPYIQPVGWPVVPAGHTNTLELGFGEKIATPRYLDPVPNVGSTERRIGLHSLPFWMNGGETYEGFSTAVGVLVEAWSTSVHPPNPLQIEAFLRRGYAVKVRYGNQIRDEHGFLDTPIPLTDQTHLENDEIEGKAYLRHQEWQGSESFGPAEDLPTEGVVLPHMQQMQPPRDAYLEIGVRYTLPYGSQYSLNSYIAATWQTVDIDNVLQVFEASDVNRDGSVTGLDVAEITNRLNWGKPAAAADNPRADVNQDGVVNAFDIFVVKGDMA